MTDYPSLKLLPKPKHLTPREGTPKGQITVKDWERKQFQAAFKKRGKT